MPEASVKRICLLASLLTALLALGVQADSWPTLQFDVFEGIPEEKWLSDDYKEVATPASNPLTPALKKEIEQYMSSVANKYQALALPAPRLPIVILEDGSTAYRIHYYDQDSGYALFGPLCEPVAGTSIHLNARKMSQNGRITKKGYNDLAHELFHAVETQTVFARNACARGIDHGKWITEGLAEAIAQDTAWELVGHTGRGAGTIDPQHRWGMRNYEKPLAVPPTGTKFQGYQSSSFWRYLAEMRYLREQLNISDLPGPERATNYHHGQTETDYSYYSILLNSAVSGSGSKAELKWLESNLTPIFKSELNQIFIDFVAVLAKYGRYRVDSNLPADHAETMWRNNVLAKEKADNTAGRCQTVAIGLSNDDVSIEIELNPVAAHCIELDVGQAGTPLNWTYQVTARNKTLLKQVRLAMAGGQQVIDSMPLKPLPKASNSDTVAAWTVGLYSGLKQYLIVANVAKQPWLTEPQTIQLRLTLGGHQNNTSPSQAGKTARVKPAPGPAGADAARQQRAASAGFQSLGAGTTSWSFVDNTEFCTGKVAARGDCKTESTITLDASASPNLLISGASGMVNIPTEMMNSATSLADDAMGYARFMEDNDGSVISLKLSGIDYGFSGTVMGVDIRVSGARESAGLRAWDPVAVSPLEPCVWGKPTGRVTIEEFTPYIMRGSFTGNLISAELPRNFKGRCPVKPIVRQASGTFVIAAPWMHDSREPIDMSWVLEDGGIDIKTINQFGSGDGLGEEADASPQAPITTATSISDMRDVINEHVECGPKDCDCSCEEYQRGMQAGQQLMSGTGQPGADDMRLYACVAHCMADVIKAGCPMGLD